MLKAIFRVLLNLIIFLYRRSGGKIGGSMQGLRVLLLTTTGRKSGQARVTPLGYFEHGGAYVVIASNAGADTHPAWYHNLRAQPQVRLQVQDRQLTALAEPAPAELRQRLWADLVQRSPAYRQYETRTARTIPIVLLRPIA
jgi:deazaflavin-dependent oxidoreductase (nitroreductase family)